MSAIVTFTPNPAVDVSTSVERIVPTNKLRCTPSRRDPGGGGINVARVVKRLGGDATAIYPRGGATGLLLSQLIAREQLSSRVSEIADETRQDFSVQEGSSGKQFRFVLPGPALTESEWQTCLDCLKSCEIRPAFVVASGSLPRGVPDDFYARAARIAKSWNARFVLDTSGPPLRAALEEGVYLCKPNLRELSDLVGVALDDEAGWARASSELVDRGQAEIVALSLGHHGALLSARDGTLRARPLPIVPVSSVGAGDSFLGAMVFSLAAGFELDQALRYAVAAGSSAVLNAGTELSHAEDIIRLAPTVVITALP
jgi:6-phosphofructokinase 2